MVKGNESGADGEPKGRLIRRAKENMRDAERGLGEGEGKRRGLTVREQRGEP
jgi:hypothetical protein